MQPSQGWGQFICLFFKKNRQNINCTRRLVKHHTPCTLLRAAATSCLLIYADVRSRNMRVMTSPMFRPYVEYTGHAGDDYGTVSRQGWLPSLNLAFSVMINHWYVDYPAVYSDAHAVYCVFWRELYVTTPTPPSSTSLSCLLERTTDGGAPTHQWPLKPVASCLYRFMLTCAILTTLHNPYLGTASCSKKSSQT